MTNEEVFHAMSAVMDMRVGRVPGQIVPSRARRSPSLISSPPDRVRLLVMGAMTFFESNRALAWRYLKDASTLLGTDSDAVGAIASPSQGLSLPGRLAAWRASRALEYIENNLGSKLGLQELADWVALSRAHFSREFKQSLGLSPMAYIAVRRIERAKLMMRSTRETLTNVALACGYSDQPHLNRCFRRAVGVSPGAWRRSPLLQDLRMSSDSRPGLSSAIMTCRRAHAQRFSREAPEDIGLSVLPR
jgi:AraC family transcriptional regulator